MERCLFMCALIGIERMSVQARIVPPRDTEHPMLSSDRISADVHQYARQVASFKPIQFLLDVSA